MNILFISSGNSPKRISSIVYKQGESLKYDSHQVQYFTIRGKGVIGYLSNLSRLRIQLRIKDYDIVHAHYSLSAFLASLAGAKPLVVSLMGSDVKSKGFHKWLIRLFYHIYKWRAVIVKSDDMFNSIGLKNAIVIPNGVDIENFRPMDKIECQKLLKWNQDSNHILFLADPVRLEKNYTLAEQAIKLLGKLKAEIHFLKSIEHDMVPVYMNAADIVLLTSLWEGSPNVIKEAMACNCPVIATDVGDVGWLFGEEPGHYITSFNTQDVAEKIALALRFSSEKGRTNGRKRLIDLGLDSRTIAKKIISLYQEIISDDEK